MRIFAAADKAGPLARRSRGSRFIDWRMFLSANRRPLRRNMRYPERLGGGMSITNASEGGPRDMISCMKDGEGTGRPA